MGAFATRSRGRGIRRPGAAPAVPGAVHGRPAVSVRRVRTRLQALGRAVLRGLATAGLYAVAVAAPLLLVPAAALPRQQAHPGKAPYDKWCAHCHGVEGRGDGEAAAYMLPRPRDFTQALYQIRTTASGQLPTDADILRVIDEGMPGTAMPGWEAKLTEGERRALVDYLKSFSRFFAMGAAPPPVEAGDAPAVTEEGLAEGREFYERIECWKCHGDAGRGDGPSAPTQEDDRGFPIRPADLTENWHFNGGGEVEDIYMRLRTGLDGTPMPSFSDLITSGFMTDEQLWHLAQYVRSLSPEEPPRVRDVIRAAQVEGALPTSPEDSAWAAAERFYVPLVGQVIVEPRWFAPTVDGVWVQALHDGDELALRVTWHDPSNSPDSAWLEWQRRVLATMQPREGDWSAAVDAEGNPLPLPDAFAVQFPRTVPEGMERPYFLMGDAREPVYLWRWDSRSARPVEALARGLGRLEPLPAAGAALSANATFDRGEWRLVFRRPLTTVDSAAAGAAPPDRLQFVTGQAIPIAFFAWDGSNGEEGRRGAISSWYYIYLDRPTPATVYATPAMTMLLTLALGLVVVGRAQRREKRSE
ncbi:MAG TPA: c-type cytochrome [Longimicrobiales bacterium]